MSGALCGYSVIYIYSSPERAEIPLESDTRSIQGRPGLTSGNSAVSRRVKLYYTFVYSTSLHVVREINTHGECVCVICTMSMFVI